MREIGDPCVYTTDGEAWRFGTIAKTNERKIVTHVLKGHSKETVKDAKKERGKRIKVSRDNARPIDRFLNKAARKVCKRLGKKKISLQELRRLCLQEYVDTYGPRRATVAGVSVKRST